jgi:hypothetical protein
MEAEAREIARLIDNPDYVRRDGTPLDVATDQVI